jgi:ABC-type phosphate transport system substrate-binding protein
MSAFKQKLARLGATAGVLAASTAAFMAVGGVTAGSALATPTCQTISGVSTLQGEGSTLQKVAQIELWTPAYTTACPTGVHFNYTGTGSGAALSAFAYNGTTVNTGEAYVGTDEAPTSTQIANAKSHAGSANPVVIPVAQTSIAVVANLPSGCTFTGGITWKGLNKIFSGQAKQWSAVENSSGCGTNAITRVVREDGSGTTFGFKSYLAKLEGPSPGKEGVGPGSVEVGTPTHGVAPVCATKKWSEIRNNGGTPNLNLNWPENLHSTTVGGQSVEEGCAAAGTLSPIVRANGGGGVVNFVKANVNTIGYAAYSDVVANGAVADAQSLQNLSEAGENTYAAPGTGTGSKQANCEGRQYTVPSSSTGLEVDWSAVLGANPNIGLEGAGTDYPLCTLTFDLSWHGATSGYSNAGYGAHSVEIGKAVKDYILREVLEAGQTALNTHGYQALPTTGGVTHEVFKAAKLAAEQIN